MNWCDYFKDIEANPFAMTPRLTVREFFEARDHAKTCKECYGRIERVVESNPGQSELPSIN